MPHNFFYHPHPLKEKEVITLSTHEAKHARVMRLHKNDPCYVLNGMGCKASATVKQTGKEVVVVLDEVEKKPEAKHKLH